jgi:hypothetical protein
MEQWKFLLFAQPSRCGMQLKEIAGACALKNYGTVAIAIKRFELKLAGNAKLAKKVDRLTRTLKADAR